MLYFVFYDGSLQISGLILNLNAIGWNGLGMCSGLLDWNHMMVLMGLNHID